MLCHGRIQSLDATKRVRFAHLLAENCKGKVFHIQPGDVGRCLLMDYLDKKSRWL